MILWLFTCSRVDVSYCVVIACGEFLPVLIYLDKMSLTWSCLNFAMIDDQINARDQKGGLLKGSFIALYWNSILWFLITYDTFFALTWVNSKRQIYLLPSGRGHDCLDWDPGGYEAPTVMDTITFRLICLLILVVGNCWFTSCNLFAAIVLNFFCV